MTRCIALTIPLLALSGVRADDAKGEKVEYTRYTDYFEKNDAKLKGDASYLAFTKADEFDKVFALRPPLMGGKKSEPLPANTFEKKLAAAVVKRGNAIVTYDVEKVTADGDTLYVQYKATAGKDGSATFASQLIVTADRGKAKKVVFIENGKTVGMAEVK